MSFEHPAVFWFLALSVPIAILHMLRVRIQVRRVSTLHFWEAVRAQDPERTALKRLVHHASLIMHLSILLLAVFAMSVPTIQGCTPQAREYTILIDNSPSMGVLEPGGKTRLQQAREEVRKILDGLGRRDKMLLMDLTLDRTSLTSDHKILEAWLDRLEVKVRGSVPLQDAISMARQVAPGSFLVMTDGDQTVDLGDVLKRAKAGLISVGTARVNIGIVAGRLEREWGQRHPSLWVKIKNTGDVPKEAVLSVRLNERLLTQARLTIPPHAAQDRTWLLEPSRFPGVTMDSGGTLMVQVDPPDVFPMDNRATFPLGPRPSPPMVLFHAGDRPPAFLERLMGLLGSEGVIDLQRSYAAPVHRYGTVKASLSSEAILMFVDDVPEGLVIAGRQIFIHPPRDVGPFVLGGVHKNFQRLSAPVSHPLLDRVDMGPVPVKEAREIKWRDVEGARAQRTVPLLWAYSSAPAVPVGAVASSRSFRAVCLSFSLEPENSDFLLRPAFPILFRNIVTWLSEPAPSVSSASPPNLLDENETEIAPVFVKDIPRPSVEPVGWLRDYAVELVAGAFVILLLLVEFALYHRGYL